MNYVRQQSNSPRSSNTGSNNEFRRSSPSKPFKLESDNSLSVDAAVEHLLRQAAQRRRENPAPCTSGPGPSISSRKAHHRCSEVEINDASVADDPSPRVSNR